MCEHHTCDFTHFELDDFNEISSNKIFQFNIIKKNFLINTYYNIHEK